MDKEIEFIKLKVDWYKTCFPWILAMVAGCVTFISAIQESTGPDEVVICAVLSVVLLFMALISIWYASLALIHRIEAPYKTKSKWINLLIWYPHGAKSEIIYASVAGLCLGGGIVAFVIALVIYGLT